jgi:iron complex outermembrane receptor protein
MRSIQSKLASGSLVAVAAMMAGTSVQAQEPDDGGNDEIVVTARQRTENIQDIPIAITAISGGQLEASGINSLAQTSGRVPGLSFGGNTNRQHAFVGMRGVGDYSRNPGFDNRVGIYVDGVYLGRSNTTNYPLYDIASVEVLRGPQGTLFGKDTLTGAINITSVQPTQDFHARAAAQIGSRDLRMGSLTVNGGLTDTLSARVHVMGRRQDGYVLNSFNGDTLGDSRMWGTRAQFRWEPGSATTIDLAGDYVRDKATAIMGDIVGPGDEDRVVGFNRTPRYDREIYGVSLRVTHRFANDYALTSISSYRKADSAYDNFELDLTPLDLAHTNYVDGSDSLSQEIRLVSPEGRRFDYVLGGFFYDENPRSNWLSPLGVLGGESTTSAGKVSSTIGALYANGTFAIADTLKLDGGVRLNSAHKKILYNQTATNPIVFAVFGAPEMIDYRDKLKQTWVDATASLRWEMSPDIKSYVSFSTAQRPGGWNAGQVFTTDIRFDGESVDAYEMGLKTQLFDRMLRLNIAAYLMDFSNMQVLQLVPSPTGLRGQITNAGAARSKGVELDFDFAPSRALSLSGGLAVNSAKFTDFPDAEGPGTPNYRGRRLIQAPKFTGSLNLQYRLPVTGNGAELVFNADYVHSSATFSDPSNGPEYYQEPYDVVGARLAFVAPDDRWQVALFARNLFNADYVQDATVNGLGTSAAKVMNEPRVIGIELRAGF